MKRRIALVVAFFAVASLVFADMPASQPSLPLQVQIAAPATKKAATPQKSAVAKPATKAKILKAKGQIARIRAADPAKKRLERLVIAMGARRISIAVNSSTIVKNVKGKIVPLSRLRAGERIIVAYRAIGGAELAAAITIQS